MKTATKTIMCSVVGLIGMFVIALTTIETTEPLPTYEDTIGNSKDPFFDQIQISVGSAPTAVQILDFNHDNLADLIVANREDGTITVLQGDGDGQFQLHSTAPAGEDPGDLAVGDFDEDGWADLIVPNHGTKHVTILYGGKNGFEQHDNSRITVDVLPHPHLIEVADMNNDGNLDFLIDDERREAVKLYFGQGDGHFMQSASIPAGTPAYTGLTVGDTDSDGDFDLVVSSNSGSSAIVKGDGTGNFLSPSELEADIPRSWGIALVYADINAIADINGDGYPDVGAGIPYAAGRTGGAFAVWFGDTDGKHRLDTDSPYRMAHGIETLTSVSAADIDGNGFEDFLVTSYSDEALMLLLGGTKQLRPVHVEVEGNPRRVSAGDLNSDGLTDLVTVNPSADEISVFLQQAN